MEIKFTGASMSPQEREAYAARAKKEHPDKEISMMELHIDGDNVDITYHWQSVPFERIRRITGYLSTSVNFNNGKKAELHDRIVHT